ncbi:MAG: CHAT domain-containing protein, partial [Cyanobacteria bacterium P01_F01_bin.42]
NLDGVVRARSLRAEAGKVVLSGGETGLVAINGLVDTSALEADAGSISVSGEDIQIGEAAQLVANASQNGDGGDISVIGAKTTQVDGLLSARGGDRGGDGGQIETSAKLGLGVSESAQIDVGAPQGAGGTWRLDPDRLFIDADSDNSLPGPDTGDHSVAASIVESALETGNVDLEANELIQVDAEIDTSAQANINQLSFVDQNGDGDLTITLNAGVNLAITQLLTGEGSVVNVNTTDANAAQVGVDVAASGATVNLGAGSFTGTQGTVVTIGKDLTLQGQGSSSTIIDGQNQRQGVAVTSGTVAIQDLAVENGLVEGNVEELAIGGGISIEDEADVTIRQSLVQNNQASLGGGIANDGTLNLIDSVVTGNRAVEAGLYTNTYEITGGVGAGIINAPDANLEIERSTISDNIAEYAAGGVGNLGTATIQSSTVSGNVARDENTLPDDDDFTYGGGIGNVGILTVVGSTVENNSAVTGGGIVNSTELDVDPRVVDPTFAGTTEIFNSQITQNSTFSVLSSTGTSQDPTQNSGLGGGGIANIAGTLTVRESNVSENSTEGEGGGVSTFGGLIRLENSSIAANTADNEGGGVYIDENATATIVSSTVSSNMAENQGGGIFVQEATASIINSTISSNTTEEIGGGINIEEDSTVTISHSTIVGNVAADNSGGIGADELADGDDTQLTISNSILSGNSAPESPEIDVENGGDDSSNINISGGFNIVGQNGDSGGFPTVATDIVPSGSTETVLDPVLRDNGGPTLTHALVDGSSAIDAAQDAGLFTDQRGVVRPQNQTPDIGAFEFEIATFFNPPTSRLIFTPEGDGGVTVTVDAFGSFGSVVTGNAFYDPVGDIGSAGTTFESGVAFRLTEDAERIFLTAFGIGGSGPLDNPGFLDSTDTSTASEFQIGSLVFELDQMVAEDFQNSQRSGSTLNQSYTITNTGSLPVAFELIRYLDGDLDFDGSLLDGGGSLVRDGQQILFETDRAGLAADSTTFVGISGTGGSSVTDNRFEAASFSGLRSRILQGDPLQNRIFGDGDDADSFVDIGQDFDITLALRNQFSLNAGESTSYSTSTFFGSGAPEEFVTPPPSVIAPPPTDEMTPPTFEQQRIDVDVVFERSTSITSPSEVRIVPGNPLTSSPIASANADIGELESAFTRTLDQYFGTSSVNVLSPELVEQTLRSIDQLQEVTPALIYAYFAESSPVTAQTSGSSLVASTDLAQLGQTLASETTADVTTSTETSEAETTDSQTLNTVSADSQCLSQQSSNPTDPLWQFDNCGWDELYPTLKQQKDDDQLILVLVTADGQTIRQPVPGATRAKLGETVKEFQRAISGRLPSSSTKQQLGQDLYQVLIEPLRGALESRSVNNLVFVMDEGLRALPMAALHDGNDYIINQYSLGFMPSMSLADTSYESIRDADLLAMGAQTFEEQSNLPSVPLELSTIQTLWNGEKYIDEAFTPDRLRQARKTTPSKIVHLATHGEFIPGKRDRSYIQFWGDNRLGLDQLEQLRLDQDPTVSLLVLSACRTALGDPNAELGFTGLAVASGVKTAMGGLWYISDLGTYALMVSFYENLKTAPIKAEALRLAQLSLVQGTVYVKDGNLVTPQRTIPLPGPLGAVTEIDLSDPYYWSGITMVGSPW